MKSKEYTGLVTARQRSCWTIMFSVVSVCQSFCPQGVPMWPLPTMHWTLPYFTISLYKGLPAPVPQQTWDLSVQGPLPQPLPACDIWWSGLKTCPNFFTWGPPASDIWWPRLETFSKLFTWGPSPTSADMWWTVKHIRLGSGRYGSYGNVFLFKMW